MRTDIADRRDEILDWIELRQSKHFICKQLKCKPETLNSWLVKLNIIYGGNQGGRGIKTDHKRKTAIEYMANPNLKPYRLKLKLLEDGIKEHRCERCGLSRWLCSKVPLEIHHKDGDKFNNSLDNFELLCPNCHALESNNSGTASKKKMAL